MDIEQRSMSEAVSSSSPGNLIQTLEVALLQCREQVRELFERDQRIEYLTKENERLRKEVASLQNGPSSDLKAQFAIQFQDLFRQNVDKQAEIDKLKEKLHNVKAKVQRRGLIERITSSPVPPAADNKSHSSPLVAPKNAPEDSKVGSALKSREISVPDLEYSTTQQKRRRSSGPVFRQPLGEISANTNPVTTNSRQEEILSVKKRKHRLVEPSIAALPELTEDGDNNTREKRASNSGKKPKVSRDSVYHRLDNLLAGEQIPSPLIPKSGNITSHEIKRESEDNTPIRRATIDSSSARPNTISTIKQPHFSISKSKKRKSHSPEDEEPFRARPVDRLNLTHFKLNPDTNGGLDYAYDQTIRGSERKCLPGCTKECCVGAWKALASTLPTLPTLNGQPMSDDDLVRWYMGPGSEEKIRNLTPLARSNLVQEARIKFVANAYGKMHRDPHERGRSPPGFWRTDMPGSQEERDDRLSAKLREREEVARRHGEAMKEGGQWKFADE